MVQGQAERRLGSAQAVQQRRVSMKLRVTQHVSWALR